VKYLWKFIKSANTSSVHSAYITAYETVYCYFLLNIKHGASPLYWGIQLSSAGTDEQRENQLSDSTHFQPNNLHVPTKH